MHEEMKKTLPAFESDIFLVDNSLQSPLHITVSLCDKFNYK